MLSTIFKNARVASTKVQTKHNRKFALASFALASALAMGLGLAAAKAEATNYYVSPAGNNTSGNSWVNAWSELNKIQWSKIKANDSILLDKGTYFTTLTVPSTVPTGVTIYQSTAAGHAGLVDIDGSANKLNVGIDIQGPLLGLYGSGNFIRPDHHELTFLVQNCATAGVRVLASRFPSANSYVVVQCVTARFNPIGVQAPASAVPATVVVSDCVLHDNPAAQVRCGSGVTAQLQYSWFFNLGSPQTTNTYDGVVAQQASANQCVFGPFLNYGLRTTPPPANAQSSFQGAQVTDSLFLDALKANVVFANPHNSSLAYSTSFSTPKNYYLQAHSNFASTITTPGTVVTGDSVVYGASVQVPAAAGPIYADPAKFPNYQYKVTGNTTALAAQQIDPLFVDSSVYTLPDTVSESTLETTSFQISRPGPGGTTIGTTLYSVPVFLAKTFPGK